MADKKYTFWLEEDEVLKFYEMHKDASNKSIVSVFRKVVERDAKKYDRKQRK